MRTPDSPPAGQIAGILDPPRPLRALSLAESPYPGMLVAGPPALLWVDAAAFGDGPAWRASADGHILTPVDVARTAHGHAVLLPQCIARLADAVAQVQLTAGEQVTVVVSVLRGAAETERLGLEEGAWWLTADGRPVLAPAGEVPWHVATADLLADLAVSSSGEPAAALAAATGALAPGRRLAPQLADLEDALFGMAAPEPLTRLLPQPLAEPSARRRAGTEERNAGRESAGRPTGSRGSRGSRGEEDPLGGAGGLSSVRQGGRSLFPRAVLRVRAVATRSTARGSAKAGRARGVAPLVLAALVAIAVLVVGLSWPDEASSEPGTGAQASTSPASASPATPATPEPAPDETTDASPHANDDGAAHAHVEEPGAPDPAETVARLADCLATGEATCRAEVLEDPARPVPPGAATSTDGREVSVLDDYGGVVALRVSAENAAGDQIVLVVRVGERWLVRDVYDLADQP